MVSTRRVRRRLRGPGRAEQVSLDLAGMSDLPDEILLEVIKDIDDESLFRLSMTSKRFNSFALPILFQRHKLEPGSGIYLVLDRLPKFILTALRTALFLHGCLSLYINGLSSDSQRLKQEMLNVLLLVKQWTGIYSLTLNFDSYIRTPINISKWKKTFIALLEITPTKCCGFYVTGRREFYDSSDRGKAMKPQRLSAANRFSIGSGPLKAVTPTAPSTSRLSTFSLHSSLLLMPQLYPKTLSLLSNSSATISCFSIRCQISAEIMSKLLQDLTFPSLSTFIFNPRISGALSFKDFVAFLCRHQTVKILEIHYAFTVEKNSLPTPSFPNLNSLHAYPRSILWLLAPAHELPALTDIGILFEDMSSAVSWEVSTAISRIRRDIHISFIIHYPPPFQDWVRRCITTRNSKKHVIRSLLNVKVLTLRNALALPEDFKITLVSWLALFPSLCSVNIMGIISGVDWKNPEHDFIKLVASTCPDLQAIGQYGLYLQLSTLRN